MNQRDHVLRELILQHVPEYGASIGNKALLGSLSRSANYSINEEDYRRVRDALIAEGLLAAGKGRGGSVMRAQAGDIPATADDDEDDFGLEAQIPAAPRTTVGRAPRKAAGGPHAAKGDGKQVISYRYDNKRKNNPHVGMVDVAHDHDDSETTWAYDPHLDPALNFDVGRSQIENLIDDALASGDEKQMRAALEQLKRMQSPYLNWTGKAERTSFEVDRVSLHVHEHIDPATILAAVQKRIKGEKGKGGGAFQADMFSAPFENLPLRDAIDFYKHERDWANCLITGHLFNVITSLRVLTGETP